MTGTGRQRAGSKMMTPFPTTEAASFHNHGTQRTGIREEVSKEDQEGAENREGEEEDEAKPAEAEGDSRSCSTVTGKWPCVFYILTPFFF